MTPIETAEELRALLGAPNERAVNKERTRLLAIDRDWLAASPFCVLATSDADGRLDASPKGDPAGSLVHVLDDTTIDAIVANCTSAGGTAQSISVPAGTYNACAMNFDNQDSKGTVWITQVPFGVARVDTTIKENGVQVSALLRSFR